MKYILLILTLLSFNAFAATESIIRSPSEGPIPAGECPGGYQIEEGKRIAVCRREVKCTKNIGMGQINQLERDRKGQLFMHSYTVDFICQPDGNYKKVVKRLN